MYRVLKFDRWMSFVFAHKDPEFWHLIIDTAERCGFEYVGAVPQKNGQSSFKKRQHPFTVLSGQLIINFRKVRNPKTIMKAHLGMEMADVVMQTIEGVIAKNNGATLEQINDELIVKGLELGFLDLLKKEYTDLTPILMNNFDYDEKSETFFIRKNTEFTTHIDVKLRIRYYLTSFLRRMERENKHATFDEIILRQALNEEETLFYTNPDSRALRQVFKTPADEVPAPRSQDTIFAETLNEAIRQNMSNPSLKMDDLGDTVGLSRVQLYRKVKSITGLSPVELLRQMRLQQGYVLLTTTDKTVQEIAYEVGFGTPGYFSKCFRQQYGKYPMELRS